MKESGINIGRVKINMSFYHGEDLYSDGEIENELLSIVKDNSNFTDILASDSRWPILYHLTPYRRNLLEWYEFNKDGRLLEIGAGCGALTGLFCEKVKEVVAVELSKRRAEIAAYRNSDKPNLEIIVGNLNDIRFQGKFDYITLIGVLEYAAKFTDAENPFLRFLSNIRTMLNQGGTLIIALENKYGLKYWSGAREDHTGKYFEGIEGYIDNDAIRTFSKGELYTLLRDAGFKNIDFYYPMPDYKIPTQIFCDKFLPGSDQINMEYPNYDQERLNLFDERIVFQNLIADKTFDFFANSFLVFCS